MPRTVEHIVATHTQAAARVAAGQPAWAMTLDVSVPFGDDDLAFEARRDAIVAILREHTWVKDHDPDGDLDLLVDNLAEAEHEDEFDFYWDELYDLADLARVWIKTF